jgi:hypothetical protein
MKDQDEKKQDDKSGRRQPPSPGKGDRPPKDGSTGYSTKKEQELVNKENETMHNERDEKDLDNSQEGRLDIDENEGSDPRKGQGM